LINQRVHECFAFYTDGELNTGDGNVAASIRHTFGLRRARLVREPALTTFDYVTELRLFLFRAYGCLSMKTAIGVGLCRDNGILHLNGGCGELLRSNYLYQLKGVLHPRELLKRMIRTRGEALIQADVVEWQCQAIDGFFDEKVGLRFDEYQAIDQYYIEQRNRQFMGVQGRARLTYRSAFYPLYSPAAVAAAFALTPERRGANRVGFELIDRFHRALLFVPLEGQAWRSAAYNEDDPQREELAAITPVMTGDPPLVDADYADRVENVIERTYVPGGSGSALPAAEPSAWANRMSEEGRHWVWTRLDTTLAALKELIGNEELLQSVSEVFRPEALKQLANRSPETFVSGTEVQQVYRVIGAILWMAGEELGDVIPSR
jgi:hypothetical protein